MWNLTRDGGVFHQICSLVAQCELIYTYKRRHHSGLWQKGAGFPVHFQNFESQHLQLSDASGIQKWSIHAILPLQCWQWYWDRISTESPQTLRKIDWQKGRGGLLPYFLQPKVLLARNPGFCDAFGGDSAHTFFFVSRWQNNKFDYFKIHVFNYFRRFKNWLFQSVHSTERTDPGDCIVMLCNNYLLQ